MGSYSSFLRDGKDHDDIGVYTADDVALLREIHQRVLLHIGAPDGGAVVQRSNGRDSERVAAAIMGLAQAGVRDPEILEKMALLALSPRDDGLGRNDQSV